MLLTGPEKAVLFLLSLDEDVAAPIVNELEVPDLTKLREVAASMREVSSDALEATYQEFVEKTSHAVAVPRGGLPYLKRLTAEAIGTTVADQVFDDDAKSPMERLHAAPPDAVAALLQDESDQLVAAIVAKLEPAAAAAVLEALPPEREATVLSRMSKLTDLPAAVLNDVARALANELPDAGAENLIGFDGISRAADILNAGGRQMSTQILEVIEEAEPELARDMRMAMFTFLDLSRLDARDMRTLLREVPTERLTIALKGAPDDVANAMFAGLSERAATFIKDDLEVLGKVRKAEIEAARQEVVQVALRLEADGGLDLGRGDD